MKPKAKERVRLSVEGVVERNAARSHHRRLKTRYYLLLRVLKRGGASDPASAVETLKAIGLMEGARVDKGAFGTTVIHLANGVAMVFGPDKSYIGKIRGWDADPKVVEAVQSSQLPLPDFKISVDKLHDSQ